MVFQGSLLWLLLASAYSPQKDWRSDEVVETKSFLQLGRRKARRKVGLLKKLVTTQLTKTAKRRHGSTVLAQGRSQTLRQSGRLSRPNSSPENGLRVEVVRKLGEGSQGEVMLAEVTANPDNYMGLKPGNKVAVKQTRGSSFDDFLALSQEAEMLCEFQHESIVRMYVPSCRNQDGSKKKREDIVPATRISMVQYRNHTRWKTVHYLVLELLSGSLDDAMEKCADEGRRMSRLAVASLGFQLVEAMEEMHRLKIYHKDIKPRNLMFRDETKLVLVDLGMASAKMNTTGGTLPYMGVNQMRIGFQGARDDLQAVGYTLLEMARGTLPWRPAGDFQSSETDEGHEVYRTIFGMKRLAGTLIADVSGGWEELAEFFMNVEALGPAQVPDYARLKKPFRDFLRKNGVASTMRMACADDANAYAVPGDANGAALPSEDISGSLMVVKQSQRWSPKKHYSSVWDEVKAWRFSEGGIVPKGRKMPNSLNGFDPVSDQVLTSADRSIAFKAVKKLGSGAFGAVFEADCRRLPSAFVGRKLQGRVAVKVADPDWVGSVLLKEEAEVLTALQPHKLKGVPEIYRIQSGLSNGDQAFYSGIMAVELLGDMSLDQILKKCPASPVQNEFSDKTVHSSSRFSRRGVALVAVQMLDVLEGLHKHSFHRDLNPGNIVPGNIGRANQLYLIDFAFAGPRFHGERSGIAEFMSRRHELVGHLGSSDELESLGWNLVYLLLGGLPWSETEFDAELSGWLGLGLGLNRTLTKTETLNRIDWVSLGYPEVAEYLLRIREMTKNDAPVTGSEYDELRQPFVAYLRNTTAGGLDATFGPEQLCSQNEGQHEGKPSDKTAPVWKKVGRKHRPRAYYGATFTGGLAKCLHCWFCWQWPDQHTVFFSKDTFLSGDLYLKWCWCMANMFLVPSVAATLSVALVLLLCSLCLKYVCCERMCAEKCPWF